jgi:putative membrane protein insertion efficiency factor
MSLTAAPTLDLDHRVRQPAGLWRRVARAPFVALIVFYQRVISPWTASSCRYYPSCSQYALVAIQRHGVVRGGWLAVRRLGRCHPWTAGGVDHVPPARPAVAAPAPAPRTGA